VISREILEEMAGVNWHQPATGVWRAVELTALVGSAVLPASGRVLDLGCGDGLLTGVIRSSIGATWELVGVDRDPAEVAQAETTGIYERIHVASADRIPEPDASFDLVFSNSVLEHVDDLPGVLAESARLLKPGGRFVATVPSERFRSMLGGPGVLGRFATGAADRRTYELAIDRRLAQLTYWSPAEWREALERVRMRIDGASYYMTVAELRRWELLSNLTAGIATKLLGAARPIEAQRRLGWRRPGAASAFRPIGSLLVEIGARGLSKEIAEVGCGACLLVSASKLEGADR
jgi:ubiquinone/menaquinone biosynthesis C-methylase UbiE